MTNTTFTFTVSDLTPEQVRRILRGVDNLLLNDLGYPVATFAYAGTPSVSVSRLLRATDLVTEDDEHERLRLAGLCETCKNLPTEGGDE